MTLEFEKAHEAFIRSHLRRRTGERRSRLERGHQHAEKLFLKNVWWPIFGNFDHLHPEYEVLDWRSVPYFIDLAYIRPYIRIGIEIKGFGPHVRDTDRVKYSQELCREVFMSGLGWRVWSFSYDDVKERPEICRMLVQMNMSSFILPEHPPDKLLLEENEIVRLACHLARPLRPIDVCRHFSVNYRTAVRWIQQLQEKGWLRPVGNAQAQRIRQYEVASEILRYWT